MLSISENDLFISLWASRSNQYRCHRGLFNPYPIFDLSVHKAGSVSGRAEGKRVVKTGACFQRELQAEEQKQGDQSDINVRIAVCCHSHRGISKI